MSDSRYHIIRKVPRVCQCGESFIPRSSRHIYCEECGKRINKEQKNKKAKTYFQKYPYFDTAYARMIIGDRSDLDYCSPEPCMQVVKTQRDGGKVPRRVLH